MSYDVLKLCEDLGDHFEVDPGVMFPATLKRIQECLRGEVPSELADPGFAGHPMREQTVLKFLEAAEAFPAEMWKKPIGPALDFAESWFKRALVLAVGRGIRIHISKNLNYRR